MSDLIFSFTFSSLSSFWIAKKSEVELSTMDSSGTLAQRANAPPPPPSFAHPHSSSAAAADAGGAAVGDGSQKKLVSLLAFHHLLLEFVHECCSSTTLPVQEQEQERGERKSGKNKFDTMGQSVGHLLCENHLLDVKPFMEDKVDEIIVWMCKIFWTKTFGKRIDSLKTNNRGTFVLLDNNFALTKTFADKCSSGSSSVRNNSSASILTATSSDGGQQQQENNSHDDRIEEQALYFASQIVKGALNRVNVNPQSVQGEFVSKRSHHAVTFTIIL